MLEILILEFSTHPLSVLSVVPDKINSTHLPQSTLAHHGREREVYLLYYLSLRLSSTLSSSLAQPIPCTVLLSSFLQRAH